MRHYVRTNMTNKDTVFNHILREIATENGYKIARVIDAVFELKKNNKRVYLKGKDLGLNSSLSNKLSQNKAITYEILRRNKIKSVPHYQIYHPEVYSIFGNQKKRNRTRINMIVKREKFPLVIKPAKGSSGENVEIVQNKREISKISKNIFERNDEIVLSPFRVINHEYRVVVLNRKVELIFDKVRTEKREFRHNLCLGAKPEVVEKTDKNYKKLEALAKRAAKTLDLNFVSVDIIETDEKGLEVLEINSMVSLGHFAGVSKENYEIAKNIYKKALKKSALL